MLPSGQGVPPFARFSVFRGQNRKKAPVPLRKTGAWFLEKKAAWMDSLLVAPAFLAKASFMARRLSGFRTWVQPTGAPSRSIPLSSGIVPFRRPYRCASVPALHRIPCTTAIKSCEEKIGGGEKGVKLQVFLTKRSQFQGRLGSKFEQECLGKVSTEQPDKIFV